MPLANAVTRVVTKAQVVRRLLGRVVTMGALVVAGATAATDAWAQGTYPVDAKTIGQGAVKSTPGGIDCGNGASTCTRNFAIGSWVELTATPAPGYRFRRWNGACWDAGACKVQVYSRRSVSAEFVAVATSTAYALTVNRTGPGSVKSTPSGVDCGPTCRGSFRAGSAVILSAAPEAGYTSTWGGACSGTSGSCTVTMDAAKTVNMTFAAVTAGNQNLSLGLTGKGTVAFGDGSSCAANCTKAFASGSTVALTASPAAGYTFAGWGGACSGTAACSVVLSAARSVTASFTAVPVSTQVLTATLTGTGTVSFSDGSTCTATCTRTFNTGTSITATASPAAGNTFAGWGGACSGTGACVLAMNATKSINTTFNASTSGTGKTYYVSNSGSDSAAGTALSSPLKTINKAVELAKAGDTIDVRAGTYNEAVVIRTAGTAAAWITLRGYNGERPVIRRTGAGPTVYFYNSLCDEDSVGSSSGNTDCHASYWVLQGLEIRGSSNGGGDGNAIKIDTAKVRLQGNKLCCSVADVVKLVRTANDVELLDNEIWQDRAVTVPGGNAQAVDIVGADRTRVINNHVHDVPDIGIYAKGNSRNTLFEGNLLVNMGSNALMLGQSTDADRLMDGNYETYNGIIRNNVVVNGAWACLATASSQAVRIYNNSCYNTGTGTHGSILLSNESEVATPGQDIEIYNNILYGSANKPIIRITSNAMSDYKTLKVDRNIYYIGGADPKFASSDHFSADVGSAGWRSNYKSLSGRDDTSLVVDPKYAGTTGSNPLTLQSTSPAINAGATNTSVVPKDRLGVARPQGASADIGAYEVPSATPGGSFALSVSLTGNGGVGIATASGAPLGCPPDCNSSYPTGTQVTLAASPVSGNVFAGWGGACSGTGLCVVTMDAAKSVSAAFIAGTTPPPPSGSFALDLTIAGAGSVSRSDSAGSSNCTSSCSKTYAAGSVVGLVATPAAGSTFMGWSGACTGTSRCELTMSQARMATATFVAGTTVDTTPPTITARSPAAGATGVGSGAVVSATFSEPVNCATVNANSFVVSGVNGVVSCSGNTASFKPAAALPGNASYTVTLTTAVKDMAGNSVASNAVWSFTTVTATPGTDAQFTFLAYGDSRGGNGKCAENGIHISLVNRMANEPASLMFHLGDMVTGYDKTTNWVQRGDCPNDATKGSFKEIISPLQNKLPAAGLPQFFFPVMGNHDDNMGEGWYPDRFGHGYCDVFNPGAYIPNHTQQSYFLDKTARKKHYTDAEFQNLACSKTQREVYGSYMYYAFDFKNTHFAVMHLNTDIHDLEVCNGGSCTDPTNYDHSYNKHQLDWLKADLAAASARSHIQNIVVLLHAPVYTASWGHAANASWPTLSKLFSQHGVRMVLQGHNHVYERSHPIFASANSPNGVRDDLKGTVYTTTGGGGSDFHGFNGMNPLMVKQDVANHYLRIDVNGSTVTVKAIAPDGTVIDNYSR